MSEISQIVADAQKVKIEPAREIRRIVEVDGVGVEVVAYLSEAPSYHVTVNIEGLILFKPIYPYAIGEAASLEEAIERTARKIAAIVNAYRAVEAA